MQRRELSQLEYRNLFDTRLCGLSTAQYLLDEDAADQLTPLIRAMHGLEVGALRARLTGPAPAKAEAKGLRIALSNVALAGFAGSELWTAEAAFFLKHAGADVAVYSPKLGDVANLIASSGISVTSSVDELVAFSPHLLHVNHFAAVKALTERLRGGVRILNMVHGLLPRAGMPGFEWVDQYCAVSVASKAKTHVLTGTPCDEIIILPNSFDADRFRSIGDFSGRNQALIHSSRTRPEHREVLRNVLKRHGFELDHIGYGAELTQTPERWLSRFDVVFAVGRSAIEAAASGAHVVLWDAGIIGPAVTPENFWECVAANFALPANVLPWRHIGQDEAARWVSAQLLVMSPRTRAEVTEKTRRYLTLQDAGHRLLEVYQRALEAKSPLQDAR